MKTTVFFVLSFLSGISLADSGPGQWTQCGGMVEGKPFSGSTACAPGFKCICKDQWWSQCRQSNDLGWSACSGSNSGPQTSGQEPSTKSNQQPTPKTPSTTPTKGDTQQQPAGSCGAWTGSKSSGYASTTHYNFRGNQGSCGCMTNDAWQTSPADRIFATGGSQSLFGGSGTWCGPNCGKCFRLTNVGALAAAGMGTCQGAGDSITVMLLDLCPAQGNEKWCNQPANEYGFGAHFDILADDGPLGWNNPVVKYEEIACPGQLKSNYGNCKCAKGAQSRVRRGIMDV